MFFSLLMQFVTLHLSSLMFIKSFRSFYVLCAELNILFSKLSNKCSIMHKSAKKLSKKGDFVLKKFIKKYCIFVGVLL
jgi:hypothetical protein